MEKPLAVAGASEKKLKVRNNLHIPYDLSLSILSKLPLKSLKRFGCVHKSWSLLFENPHFMSMLRTHFSSNNRSGSDHGGGDTFLLLKVSELILTYRYVYHSSIYLLSNERFENGIELDLPPPFQEDDTNLYVLSSVSINGILCIGQDRIRGMVQTFRAVLWNPATTEFTVIPPSPDESVPPYRSPTFEFHEFGYDRVRDDYKVIRYTSFFPLTDEDEDVPYEDRSYDPLLEIYSLRSNSWMILDEDVPYFFYNHPLGVYKDGVCHWWIESASLDDEDYLLSFDFINGVFLTTPMLLDVDESCDFVSTERCLVVLNESIALISNCLEATTFHISILGEIGEKKSWIKLFIVGPISFVRCPIGVGKKGNICFKKKDDELVWVDLSTQRIDEIGVKGEYCQIGIYKETHIPIRGINN